MEALFLLIPVSIVIVAIAGYWFLWAVNNDQFDNLDSESLSIFADDPNEQEEKDP